MQPLRGKNRVATVYPGSRQRTLGYGCPRETTLKRLHKRRCRLPMHPRRGPFGVKIELRLFTQGALPRPWAVECNPFGAGLPRYAAASLNYRLPGFTTNPLRGDTDVTQLFSRRS